MIPITMCAVITGVLLTHLLGPAESLAQQRSSVADSLVDRALNVNPRLRAAEAQAAAARSRIAPAAAWPDPMLMAGVQNLPLSREAAPHGTTPGPDPMTMRMLGVAQTVPFPGKTRLRATIAQAEAQGAEARVATLELAIRREVLEGYFDVVAARSVLTLIQRQQQVASSIVPVADARYVAGTAAQADLLKARIESALLLDERYEAERQERSALARLNALLDQAAGGAIQHDSLPDDLLAARRTLPVDSLGAIALRSNPRLRERRALVAAQTARAELARRDYLPDFDIAIQYGQRDRRPDMISATIAVPLPVQRGRKQNASASAARYDLAAAERELRAEENEILDEVTRTHAAVERNRANLQLIERAILPQTRATFVSVSGNYESGRGEMLDVLDAMRALFASETMYVRALAEYAKSLAGLQALLGEEIRR